MTKIELLYFEGCPNLQLARDALKTAGIHSYEEVEQGSLARGDKRRRYASPSLLIDDQLVAGALAEEASCFLGAWDPEAIVRTRSKLR